MIRSALVFRSSASLFSRSERLLEPRLSSRLTRQRLAPNLFHNRSTLRAFSSNAKKENTNDAEADTKEIVLTPGEKVVVAGRLGLWLAVGGFAAVCAFYIGKELLPT